MKKFTFTTTMIALSATTAQAYMVFDNNSTKIDLDGSLRLAWRSDSYKQNIKGAESREHINRAVYNNSSRFGFKIIQQLSEEFYAVGRMQFRFRGDSSSQHNFDHIYTRYAYIGVGHKKYGELTYGNQLVYTDYVRQTDLLNTLSFADGYFNTTQRNSLQYVYKGIPGLALAAFYAFEADRNASMRNYTRTGTSNYGNGAKRKIDAYGTAAVYKHELRDGQKFTLAFGADRERFENRDNTDFERTNYAFGSAYTFENTTVGLDLEQLVIKNQGNAAVKTKTILREVRAVALQRLTPDWNIYAQYGYNHEKKERNTADSDEKIKRSKYTVGAEYVLIRPGENQPFRVKTFLEGQYIRGRTYDYSGSETRDRKDKAAVIGLRVYW